MKRLTALFLCLMALPALADTAVTVEVRNVDRDEGTMVLTVFEGKKNWLKRGTLQEKLAVDGNETVTFTLQLPPGEYAFHAYQDLDDNGKMKSNFIGIPKEPTAVSNDAKGKFGPPKYKDAKVTVGEEPVAVPMNLVSID
jgi:uncharacterized protein (DUF2141 family)